MTHTVLVLALIVCLSTTQARSVAFNEDEDYLLEKRWSPVKEFHGNGLIEVRKRVRKFEPWSHVKRNHYNSPVDE
ncbi:hypothetical protein CLF_102425 [Clonorchis sinensis]|nr:hypothetical protein CLF_102425 [Clonorchis sinensis]